MTPETDFMGFTEIAELQTFEDGGAEGIRTPDPHNAIVCAPLDSCGLGGPTG